MGEVARTPDEAEAVAKKIGMKPASSIGWEYIC
jgi:hypothetical protein